MMMKTCRSDTISDKNDYKKTALEAFVSFSLFLLTHLEHKTL